MSAIVNISAELLRVVNIFPQQLKHALGNKRSLPDLALLMPSAGTKKHPHSYPESIKQLINYEITINDMLQILESAYREY